MNNFLLNKIETKTILKPNETKPLSQTSFSPPATLTRITI